MDLIHFTKDIESAISILENGFYYSWRPTRIFQRLFEDAKIDAVEPNDHGMICFTELDYFESTELRQRFGDIGITVSGDWAIQNGAKKVNYIKKGDTQYSSFLKRLNDCVPKTVYGYSLNEQNIPMMEKTLRQQMFAHPASSMFFGIKDSYKDLFFELSYSQISDHSYQKEWRIRNINSLSGIQFQSPSDLDKKYNRINFNPPNMNREQMMHVFQSNPELKMMLHLQINPGDIVSITVPKSYLKEIKKAIKDTRFSKIKINVL